MCGRSARSQTHQHTLWRCQAARCGAMPLQMTNRMGGVMVVMMMMLPPLACRNRAQPCSCSRGRDALESHAVRARWQDNVDVNDAQQYCPMQSETQVCQWDSERQLCCRPGDAAAEAAAGAASLRRDRSGGGTGWANLTGESLFRKKQEHYSGAAAAVLALAICASWPSDSESGRCRFAAGASA